MTSKTYNNYSKDGYVVEIAEDAIYLHDENHEEIVSWNTDEFAEDPTVAIAALNALSILLTEGSGKLKSIIETGGAIT